MIAYVLSVTCELHIPTIEIEICYFLKKQPTLGSLISVPTAYFFSNNFPTLPLLLGSLIQYLSFCELLFFFQILQAKDQTDLENVAQNDICDRVTADCGLTSLLTVSFSLCVLLFKFGVGFYFQDSVNLPFYKLGELVRSNH